MLLPAMTVGSLPKPGWLAEPEKLWAPWRLDGEALQRGKERAALAWLRERYRNHLIPHGQLSAIAREFAVSRQLVHRVAVKDGFLFLPKPDRNRNR